MKNRFLLFALLSTISLFAQDELIKKVIGNASASSNFVFTDVLNIQNTSVKNQGRAGTCWSYSANSFLESEMIRKGKKPVDVAEIYGARCVYLLKAKNYILTNGNLALGDGGETHDIMNMLRQYGAMPQSAYTFENYGNGAVIPSEFQAGLKTILDNYIKNPNATKGASWKTEVSNYLDEKLGKLPETFTYEGKNYTPRSFADEVIGINPNDYIEFASFNDNPYYKKMVLPFADNWSHDLVYNLPMKEMTDVIDFALAKGFTIAWSADVSESFFSWRNGVAFVPDVTDIYALTDEEKKVLFDGPKPEKVITEDMRLEGIYTLKTTDDHAMQIVGVSKDQNGKEYYKVKNSWGETNDYKGYLYVTKAFVQLKTTGILLNKAGVSKTIKSKLI